jgi:hypothetical protein
MPEEKKPKRKKLIIIGLIVLAVLAYKSGRLDSILEKMGISAEEVQVEPAPDTKDTPEEDSIAEA